MENSKSFINVVLLVALVLIAIGVFSIFSGSDDSVTVDDSSSTTSEAVEEEASEETTEEAESATESNIVELAQATDDLSVLVSAVVAADLVDTLSGEGPFTVFAPTNDAFTDLLTELDITADELLDRDDLADILTYHVVSGEVLAADLSDGQVVTTVQGGELTVSIGEAVTLTDANGGEATVTATDIDATNGVVHLIGSVVLP